MTLRWYEWALLVVGGGALVVAGSALTGKFQEALASPSGAAYGWAIGVLLALLAGIVGVSVAFSWLRSWEARREQTVLALNQTAQNSLSGKTPLSNAVGAS